MFRGCKTEDTPPHIYSMSQAAYRSMIATKRDQSIGRLLLRMNNNVINE